MAYNAFDLMLVLLVTRKYIASFLVWFDTPYIYRSIKRERHRELLWKFVIIVCACEDAVCKYFEFVRFQTLHCYITFDILLYFIFHIRVFFFFSTSCSVLALVMFLSLRTSGPGVHLSVCFDAMLS